MRRYAGLLVAAGILLFAAVFFGVLIVIALDRLDEQAGADSTPEAATGCEFVPSGGPVLVYDRYDSGAPDAANALPANQTYPATQLSAQRVRIVIGEGKTGWVDRAAGVLEGTCDGLPVVDES